MSIRATALAAGIVAALGPLAASGALAAPGSSASGSAPVTETNVDQTGSIRVHEQGTVNSSVVNFPLDAAGNLKVSGSAVVSGTVAATQSGPWSVALDAAPAASLSNIESATAGLRYDTDGNLQVSLAGGGSPADPSVADQSPFGFSSDVAVNAGESFTVQANPSPVRITSFFVQVKQGEATVFFQRNEGVAFAFRLAAGQSLMNSPAHAILADAMRVQCASGGNHCILFHSVTGY